MSDSEGILDDDDDSGPAIAISSDWRQSSTTTALGVQGAGRLATPPSSPESPTRKARTSKRRPSRSSGGGPFTTDDLLAEQNSKLLADERHRRKMQKLEPSSGEEEDDDLGDGDGDAQEAGGAAAPPVAGAAPAAPDPVVIAPFTGWPTPLPAPDPIPPPTELEALCPSDAQLRELVAAVRKAEARCGRARARDAADAGPVERPSASAEEEHAGALSRLLWPLTLPHALLNGGQRCSEAAARWLVSLACRHSNVAVARAAQNNCVVLFGNLGPSAWGRRCGRERQDGARMGRMGMVELDTCNAMVCAVGGSAAFVNAAWDAPPRPLWSPSIAVLRQALSAFGAPFDAAPAPATDTGVITRQVPAADRPFPFPMHALRFALELFVVCGRKGGGAGAMRVTPGSLPPLVCFFFQLLLLPDASGDVGLVAACIATALELADCGDSAAADGNGGSSTSPDDAAQVQQVLQQCSQMLLRRDANHEVGAGSAGSALMEQCDITEHPTLWVHMARQAPTTERCMALISLVSADLIGLAWPSSPAASSSALSSASLQSSQKAVQTVGGACAYHHVDALLSHILSTLKRANPRTGPGDPLFFADLLAQLQLADLCIQGLLHDMEDADILQWSRALEEIKRPEYVITSMDETRQQVAQLVLFLELKYFAHFNNSKERGRGQARQVSMDAFVDRQ